MPMWRSLAPAANDSESPLAVTSPKKQPSVYDPGEIAASGSFTPGFSAAMAFGIVVGTYSSIYQAAPILIWLKVGSHSFVPDEEAGSKAERIIEGFES